MDEILQLRKLEPIPNDWFWNREPIKKKHKLIFEFAKKRKLLHEISVIKLLQSLDDMILTDEMINSDRQSSMAAVANNGISSFVQEYQPRGELIGRRSFLKGIAAGFLVASLPNVSKASINLSYLASFEDLRNRYWKPKFFGNISLDEVVISSKIKGFEQSNKDSVGFEGGSFVDFLRGTMDKLSEFNRDEKFNKNDIGMNYLIFSIASEIQSGIKRENRRFISKEWFNEYVDEYNRFIIPLLKKIKENKFDSNYSVALIESLSYMVLHKKFFRDKKENYSYENVDSFLNGFKEFSFKVLPSNTKEFYPLMFELYERSYLTSLPNVNRINFVNYFGGFINPGFYNLTGKRVEIGGKEYTLWNYNILDERIPIVVPPKEFIQSQIKGL